MLSVKTEYNICAYAESRPNLSQIINMINHAILKGNNILHATTAFKLNLVDRLKLK